MKRMLALFLAVLLLTGCTAKTAKREPDKERETETIAVTDAKFGSSPEAPEPAEPILACILTVRWQCSTPIQECLPRRLCML